METLFLDDCDEQLDTAAKLIKSGEVVGIPTETVYGLGADAANEAAVRKIFAAKGRPADNPLIVHLADFSDAVRIPDEEIEIMCKECVAEASDPKNKRHYALQATGDALIFAVDGAYETDVYVCHNYKELIIDKYASKHYDVCTHFRLRLLCVQKNERCND